MLATVREISPEGLVLISADTKGSQEFWLPREEWSEQPVSWSRIQDDLQLGDELDIALLPSSHSINNRPVVTRRSINAHDLASSASTKARLMTVTSVSKTLIRGSIASVPAVADLREYIRFLDTRGLVDRWRDHAAIGPGDTIRGIVKTALSDKGEVSLDICQFLEVLDGEATADKRAGEPADHGNGDVLTAAPLPELPTDTIELCSPILLVENDDAILDALAILLRRAGFDVTTAAGIEEARSRSIPMVEGSHDFAQIPAPYGMAIVDVALRDSEDDEEGLELVGELLASTHCRIIVITGEMRHRRKLNKWAELKIHDFLEKPFTTEELFDCIRTASEIDPMPLRHWVNDEPSAAALPEAGEPRTNVVAPIRIREALETLRASRKGAVVHLFRIHPRSLRATWIDGCGSGFRWEPFRGKIGRSLIKDAALSNRPIVEQDAHLVGAFLWTQKMISHRSFFGSSIDINDGYRYALVAFHEEPGAFDDEFQRNAEFCCERIARCLQRDMLTASRSIETEFAVMGKAFECMAHELHNDLVAQDAVARVLAELWAKEELSHDDLALARHWTSRLGRRLALAVEKTDALRGSGTDSADVRLYDCVHQALKSCERVIVATLAHPERVILKEFAEPEEESPVLRGNKAVVTMILFNLILNAAQQIHDMFPIRRAGKAWVEIEKRVQSGNKWCLVRVHDTGPGIHPEDWERVFLPGFSTKERGSGLGLYLSRQLLRSEGAGNRRGSLWISRSAVWGGTTFTLKLSLSATERKNK